MKTVLVVEDRYDKFEMINVWLDDKVRVLHAPNLSSAERLFDENQKDIDLVIMDACVDGEKPDTMPLIRQMIATGFNGAIIANSSCFYFNDILIEAGATHKTLKKLEAGTLALQLLGL